MDVLRVTMVGDDVARKENVAYMHHGTAGIAGMVTVYNGLDQPCLLVPPQQQGWPRHDDGILQKKLALNFHGILHTYSQIPKVGYPKQNWGLTTYMHK